MTPTKVENTTAIRADGVIAAELKDIRVRRETTHGFTDSSTDSSTAFTPDPNKDADAQLTDIRNEALEQHLVGMSFSGGGIRSGTFAVGFLQGLASLGLLRRIDYLSTVSGGGYASAWLAAWVKREGQLGEVEKQLDPSRVTQNTATRTPLNGVVDEEPEPIRHLREYDSFMMPQPGALTADTWSIIATWLRNVTINLMMLLPMILVVVLIARIVVYLYNHVSHDAIDTNPEAHLDQVLYYLLAGGFLFMGIRLVVLGSGLSDVQEVRRKRVGLGIVAIAVSLLLFTLTLGWDTAELWRWWVMSEADFWKSVAKHKSNPGAIGWTCFGAGLATLLAGIILNATALGEFRRRAGSGAHPEKRQEKLDRRLPNVGAVASIDALLLIGASVLLTIPLRGIVWAISNGVTADDKNLRGDVGAISHSWSPVRDAISHWLSPVQSFFKTMIESQPGLLGLPNILLHVLVIGGAMTLAALAINWRNGTLYTDIPPKKGFKNWYVRYMKAALIYTFAAFLAGATAGLLLPLLEVLARTLDEQALPYVAATILPPLGMLIMIAAFIVEVGLNGRQITEAEREWWGRLSATLMIGAILWTLAMATVIYVPALFLSLGVPLRVALTSGWLSATAFGVIAGRKGRPEGGPSLSTIATFMPMVFLIGLIGAISLVAAFLVNSPPPQFTTHPGELTGASGYFLGVVGTTFSSLAIPILGAYVIYWIANRFIDVNLFSLHAMYANRLVRCYVGASRPKPRWQTRWGGIHDPRVGGGAPSLIPSTDSKLDPLPDRDPNPATGFDLTDDIPLYDFRIGKSNDRDYYGPYLLFNTTLNLVAGGELAWRDRKGESFVMTPRHCGSKSLGYADLDATTRENLTLGRAITISGASIDPNMKYYQSAALSAFLTIFNARLGFWIRNPLFTPWNADSPKMGDRLWVELFGETDGTDEYVHLSDGGHFENLGVYELIRRRCRYVIILDSGEDADASNDNLSELIRLCRIDFGIGIELDTRPLQAIGPDKLTSAHVVVGRIRYDDVDSGQMPGTLIYVKISLTGDEPPDLQKYAKADPRFPHHPADLRQTFSEEQFECYRALGEHMARDVFKDAVNSSLVQAEQIGTPSDAKAYIRGNQRLFAAIRSRWSQQPAQHDENYVRASREWTDLIRDIRKDPELKSLSDAIYPETKAADHHERQTVAQMLQVMEDAWISLGMKTNANLPIDRGWMNVFRRWANTDAFRRLWPAFRPEFSPGFVQFCESQLHMVAATPVLLRVPRDYATNHRYRFESTSIATLTEEFAREWPSLATPEPISPGALVSPPKRGLAERIAEALKINPTGDPPIWLIVEAPSGYPTADQAPADEKFPGGIFLIGEYLDVNVDLKRGIVQQSVHTGPFELFTWIRRPRRSEGLGTQFIDTVLNEARTLLGAGTRLRVRYPKSGQRADTDQSLEMWKSFYALHDFKPVKFVRLGTRESVMKFTL